MFLNENVQHGTMFIYSPPEPMLDSADVEAHLAQVPTGTPSGFPLVKALREQCTEFDAPSADGLAGDSDPPLQEEFFIIPVAEGEAVVELHGVTNHSKGNR